jgi:ATP-dependent helicase/nuclease subunit B
MLNLYSIAAGASFLDRLAQGLIARFGADGLAGIDVALPNRRAVRGLIDAFLRQGGGRIMLLPNIRAIGDVDEDDLILDPAPGLDDLAIPPAIAPLERQMILARLILAAQADIADIATAAQLAQALGHLIDEVTIQKLSFADIAKLVPERFADHWQKVLDFLKIVTLAWPEILAERGVIDAADRRGRLIEALTARIIAKPPARPFIIAGSTGSIPASAALMAAVARLHNGMVILPGLDFHLDAAAFDALDPGHPQWGMSQTLSRMGAGRADVRPFDPDHDSGPSARAILLSEALRPADTADQWQTAANRLGAVMQDALTGLTLIEATSEVDEAAAIALALRHALETPDRTAALVTPDRNLARRVTAELARWRLVVDDSAGRPLSKTDLGIYLGLILDAADEGRPAEILALLKHPFCRLGLHDETFLVGRQFLELKVLRGLAPPPGIDQLVEVSPDGPARIVASALADALGPLSLSQARLPDWIDALALAADNVSARPGDVADLWQGDAGDGAVGLLSSARQSDDLPDMALADFSALILQLMDQTPIRPRFGTHPRLSILGPIEARLQRADLMILAGLNEETWPQAGAIDPWFSRPMRADFGLDPPERRLGQSAHDFVMAASAPLVILTRSVKVGTSPTVPSRWLLRLQTLVEGLEHKIPIPDPDHDYVRFAGYLDRPEVIRPIGPPSPRPAVAVRPRQLSVTQVETLIRDPYAIYARHILRLRKLDPIDQPIDAAIRGTLVHALVEEFARTEIEHAAYDIAQRASLFRAIAVKHLGRILHHPATAGLWLPRVIRMADWLAENWAEIKAGGRIIGVEVKGQIKFVSPGGEFTLTAKADRIDQRPDGLVIVDYKTGTPPKKPEIEAGFAAQFPLEGAIAHAGGFKDIPAQKIARFLAIKLSGGTPAGFADSYPKVDAQAVSLSHFAEFKKLIAQYDNPDVPYLSRPRVKFLKRYNDYDHLARVGEWSTQGEEAEE